MVTEVNTITIYLKFIDGSEAYLPVEASELGNNTFLILPNENYDENDYTELWSFRPGDKVKAKIEKFEFPEAEGLVAYELANSADAVRDYNWFLYNFLTEKIQVTRNNRQEFEEYLDRLANELGQNKMHYPGIVRKFEELENA